jgi:hypothetical protein
MVTTIGDVDRQDIKIAPSLVKKKKAQDICTKRDTKCHTTKKKNTKKVYKI